MIRYPHTKSKEILIINIIYPHTTLTMLISIDRSDSFPLKGHLSIDRQVCPFYMDTTLSILHLKGPLPLSIDRHNFVHLTS